MARLWGWWWVIQSARWLDSQSVLSSVTWSGTQSARLWGVGLVVSEVVRDTVGEIVGLVVGDTVGEVSIALLDRKSVV